MKTIQLSAVLLCISPLIVRAGGPATRPVVPTVDVIVPGSDPGDVSPGDVLPGLSGSPGGPAQPEDPHNRRADRAAQRGLKMFQPPTEKEVADAMIFMQAHSPRRYEAIQSLPDGEKKTGIRNFAVHSYQNWLRLETEDAELFSVVKQRLLIEDEIFGKMSDLKKQPPDKQDELNAELKQDVGKLLDIGLQERQLRLDRLESTIKEEQQKLDKDKEPANRSALVEERINYILKSNDARGLIPDAGPGMPGGGDKGGPGGGPGGPGRGHNGPRQP